MQYLSIVLLFVVIFRAMYYSINDIRIGAKEKKSDRYKDEKDLKRVLYRGSIGLGLETMILLLFLIIVLGLL